MDATYSKIIASPYILYIFLTVIVAKVFGLKREDDS